MANKLYCIAVKSKKQLDAEILRQVDFIVLCPESYSKGGVKAFLDSVGRISEGRKPPVFLDLPLIAMSGDISVLRGILGQKDIKDRLAGVVANNAYALKLAEEYGLDAFKGMGMNTLNDNFCGFNNIILSPEINEQEYRQFRDWDRKNYFLCVYGYLTLMTLAHCPYQANGFDCGNCERANLQYKDELGNVMGIRRIRLASCYFELLNSVPLSMLNYKNKIKPHFYFDMRETEKSEIIKILKLFMEPGNKEPEGKHTAGLYFKSIK